MREDLKKIIEDNWEDIQTLIIEKAKTSMKPKTIWDLDIDDREEYCLLNSNGYISNEIFNTFTDECSRNIGNAFLTLEEAEFERERRKIEAVMKKYSRPFEYSEDNYHLKYFCRSGSICILNSWEFNDGLLYFESKEIARKAIDEIGRDRLKKYWFGVADNER